MTPTVVVIGGGIAGLSAAWELTRLPPGPRVILLESDGRLGGKLRTEPFGGRDVDLGPDAFVARRPEALALCAELGLTEDLVAPAVRRAYVWARGRLRLLPEGLALGVPTRFGPLMRSGICSPAGLVGPARDLCRRQRRPGDPVPGNPVLGNPAPGDPGVGDLAVGEIVRRRLGDQVGTRLAGPLIGGIHAGNIDLMSAAAVFPALLEADRRPASLMRALRAPLPADAGGPVFLTVRGGIGRLADELVRALDDAGVELRRHCTVTALRRVRAEGAERWSVTTGPGPEDELTADAVVACTPAPAAADLLRPHDGRLADSLAAITYASVAIVTLRFADDAVDHSLDASGFLVPRGEKGAPDPLVTGSTWLSSKWPGLARPGDVLVRASVGRQGDDRHTEMTDSELVGGCLAELGAMMGLRRPPLDTVVTRWPQAFPQYAVGHRDRLAAIEEAAAGLPGIALAGAALHGVGIPACIGSGRRAARAVLR